MSLIVQFLTNIGLKTPDFEKAPYLEPFQDLTLGLSISLINNHSRITVESFIISLQFAVSICLTAQLV